MGCYINRTSNGSVLRPKGKAEALVNNGDAVFLNGSPTKLPEKRAIICVVDNGAFEAAAWCYSESELKAFKSPDGRTKKWLSMDKNLAKELANGGSKGFNLHKPVLLGELAFSIPPILPQRGFISYPTPIGLGAHQLCCLHRA